MSVDKNASIAYFMMSLLGKRPLNTPYEFVL